MLPRLVRHSAVDAVLCASSYGADIAKWFEIPLAIEYCMCQPLTLSRLGSTSDKTLADALRRFSPDVIYLPVERYIKFNNISVVNMVRNMEPFVQSFKGDPINEIFKKFIQRNLSRNSIRRADHTIAVSGFVKDYLMTTLHVPKNKVTQVYHGLETRVDLLSRRPSLIPIGWDKAFMFTCGSIRPARGLEDVFSALSELETRGIYLRLVIAGQTSPGMANYRKSLERYLFAKSLSKSVCWAGNLNDEEMLWCYEKCNLFIMTSRVEACSNIALEALSSGAVTIAADNPPLPELFSDCASYYEPGNGRSLAEAIVNLRSLATGERLLISERAKERSNLFSWDTAAEKTIEILLRVLMRSKNSN